jgi:hypothetical protein
MSITNLTGQKTSKTYQNLLQVSSSGALFNGTGSAIQNLSVTSSFAITASYALNAGSSILFNTGSFVTTSSFNLFTSSYNTGSFAGTFSGNFNGTSSWASNAISSSYAINSSFAGNSTSSSYTISASYSQNSTSASNALFATNAQNAVIAATASNILGGKAPHIPFFITDTTLATSSLYQSGSSTVIINQDNATSANPEALYVWQPSTSSFNVISGKGNLNNYLQLNIQNTNQGTAASSDVVATADNGNESTNYIDMGINSENYNVNFIGGVNDAYLYSTGRHLHIGNASNFPVQIFAGGSDVDIHNKLELNPNNQHSMSGSLDVSGSVKAFSFTGSLQGNATTATNATNATSASHATVADSATYAAIAGNGGVTKITAGVGVTLIPANGEGNVTVIATGTGGVTIISGSLITGSFVNATSFTFNHNLNTRTPIITVFDSNYNQIIPENIQLVNSSSAVITFPTPESGFAIGSTGGTTGTALSASYALLAEYANTASFYQETDPIYIAQKPTLATTGSNTFRGNQIITGSLTVSGSSTFTNIGLANFTGSVNITGSTTQTGNNTLIGITTLSGSINVSGSQNFIGSSSFFGNHILSGSNTIRGNTFMFGDIQVSGSSNFNNSQFTVTGSTSILGNLNVKGTSTFSNTTFTITGSQYFTGSSFINGNQNLTGNSVVTGSLNVIGNINVISGSSFTRWGNKLFNYGQFSSTQTQSGSADTAHYMTYNTIDFAQGVSVVSSSRITVENTGIYNIQFSAQLGNTTNTNITFDIWFAYTGSNVPNSNTQIDVNKSAAQLGRSVAAWNFATPIQAGDYIELYWSCNSATGQIVAAPTQTVPTRPAIPSVILTVTQIA